MPMRVQLARLFGQESPAARAESRTPQEWRRTLQKVIDELDRYVEANVDTDDLHGLMIASGLYAASEALKEEEFWPGYAEGITRLALLLLGDYPDQRRRKRGRKPDGFYDLSRFRSVHYHQSPAQKLYTLLAAGRLQGLKLSKDPRDAMSEFRAQAGYQASYKEFFRWYRRRYPADYAALF